MPRAHRTGPSIDFAVHRVLHGAKKYGVENLANLSTLPATGAFVIVAPLKIAGGSGAPTRVIAELPEASPSEPRR